MEEVYDLAFKNCSSVISELSLEVYIYFLAGAEMYIYNGSLCLPVISQILSGEI